MSQGVKIANGVPGGKNSKWQQIKVNTIFFFFFLMKRQQTKTMFWPPGVECSSTSIPVHTVISGPGSALRIVM